MKKTKVVSFLDNPPRGARRATKRRRHHGAVKRAASKKRRSHKRQPPKGFKDWKAYFASIRRPKAKKRAHRSNPSQGVTVARKRRKRRASAPRKQYHRRRHHARRNPPIFGRLLGKHTRGNGPVAFAIATVGRSVVGVGGEVFVRKVRGSLFKQAPGTIMGSGIEALLGLVGGFLLSRVHQGAGAAFAQGAVSAPLRTEIQQLSIPHISDSLGDDGYVMGPGTGVTLISAYPGDYAGVVQGEDGEATMGRYVSGDQMGAYVAGAINAA
jgi:hypothetical protein